MLVKHRTFSMHHCKTNEVKSRCCLYGTCLGGLFPGCRSEVKVTRCTAQQPRHPVTKLHSVTRLHCVTSGALSRITVFARWRCSVKSVTSCGCRVWALSRINWAGAAEYRQMSEALESGSTALSDAYSLGFTSAPFVPGDLQ